VVEVEVVVVVVVVGLNRLDSGEWWCRLSLGWVDDQRRASSNLDREQEILSQSKKQQTQ
jgi:hypothetical protein